MYDPYSEFTKYTLPNGLEIHHVFWDRPWVQMKFLLHSGAREDPIEKPGMAHFVEHLVSKNIPDYDYAGAREFFEGCGGHVDFGGTSYLSTVYDFSIPSEAVLVREALNIFGSMLMRAKFERFVERERKVILREFNDHYPFPEKMEWQMGIRRHVFKGHRLETWFGPGGEPRGFMGLTQADLQVFYDKHYVPRNMSVVVVGGLSADKIIQHFLTSPFGTEKDGPRNGIPAPLPQFPDPSVRSMDVRFSDYASLKLDRSEYLATWAFPSMFSVKSCNLFTKMIRHMLMDELREKGGLTYGVNVRCDSFQDVHSFKIQSSISPEITDLMDDIVDGCISGVVDKSDLFEKKRRSFIRNISMVDLSGAQLVEYSVEDLSFYQRIIPIQEGLDELEKVEFVDMLKCAEVLSRERRFTRIIRP